MKIKKHSSELCPVYKHARLLISSVFVRTNSLKASKVK